MRKIATQAARDDKALFFFEDAAGYPFETELNIPFALSKQALLLLILALRRVESLGGQRRRGKGRAAVKVSVTRCDEVPALSGLQLPSGKDNDGFLNFALPILESRSQAKNSPAAGEPVVRDKAESPASARTDPTCWMVFARTESAMTLGFQQAIDNIIESSDAIPGTNVRGPLPGPCCSRDTPNRRPSFAKRSSPKNSVLDLSTLPALAGPAKCQCRLRPRPASIHANAIPVRLPIVHVHTAGLTVFGLTARPAVLLVGARWSPQTIIFKPSAINPANRSRRKRLASMSFNERRSMTSRNAAEIKRCIPLKLFLAATGLPATSGGRSGLVTRCFVHGSTSGAKCDWESSEHAGKVARWFKSSRPPTLFTRDYCRPTRPVALWNPTPLPRRGLMIRSR